MPGHLVIGYGNLDRGDDGVAYYVINSVRRRLGQQPLLPFETGLEGLNGENDSIFLPQLVPEVVEIAAAYDTLVFVDASVYRSGPALSMIPVPLDSASSSFTHHMDPSLFMGLVSLLHGASPSAFLLTVRGTAFDFYRGLSPGTGALVESATDMLLDALENGCRPDVPRIPGGACHETG